MKKFVAILLACVMVLTIPMCASASYHKVKVDVNGEALKSNGIIVDDRTLVPVRAISEALNATVSWDSSTQKITLTKTLYYVDIDTDAESTKTRTVEMWIGKRQALVDGQSVSLNVSPRIIGGKTMLPVRDVSEWLDAAADWDADSNAVYIGTYSHESFSDARSENTFISDLVKKFTVDGWMSIGDLQSKIKLTFNNDPNIGPVGFYDYRGGKLGKCFYEVTDFDGDYGKTTSEKSTGGDDTYDFNSKYSGIRMRGTNSSIEFYMQDLVTTLPVSEI